MSLKINWSVKTPWHGPSMGVAGSELRAPVLVDLFSTLINLEGLFRYERFKIIIIFSLKKLARHDLGPVSFSRWCLDAPTIPFTSRPLLPIVKNGRRTIRSVGSFVFFTHSSHSRSLFYSKSCLWRLVLVMQISSPLSLTVSVHHTLYSQIRNYSF